MVTAQPYTITIGAGGLGGEQGHVEVLNGGTVSFGPITVMVVVVAVDLRCRWC